MRFIFFIENSERIRKNIEILNKICRKQYIRKVLLYFVFDVKHERKLFFLYSDFVLNDYFFGEKKISVR